MLRLVMNVTVQKSTCCANADNNIEKREAPAGPSRAQARSARSGAPESHVEGRKLRLKQKFMKSYHITNFVAPQLRAKSS